MIFSTEDDLDLGLIAASGQCFRWSLCDDGAYRILSSDKAAYISDRGDNTYVLECDDDDISYWHDYLDLDECYRDIRHRIDKKTDPFLWEASRHQKGYAYSDRSHGRLL